MGSDKFHTGLNSVWESFTLYRLLRSVTQILARFARLTIENINNNKSITGIL